MTKWVGAGIIAVISALVAWIMWGPILHWIWAQFPKDASWYGFINVGWILLVGCFGGISIPFVLLVLGVHFFFNVD